MTEPDRGADSGDVDRGDTATSGAPLGTLERGLYLLGLFTAESPERSLRELREQSGLPKATVRRLAITLENLGWLVHDPERGLYRLGPRLLTCCHAMTSVSILTNVAHPHLVELAAATTESAMLSTWGHDGALTLDLVTTPRHFKPFTAVGMVMSGLATADAQVLTAFSPENYWDARYIALAEQETQSATDGLDVQRRVWTQVRQTGVAFDREGWKQGVCAVAAPVLDSTGHALASVSVVLPSERAGNGALERYADAVQETGAAVSRALHSSRSPEGSGP